jgi:hypothetical protein
VKAARMSSMRLVLHSRTAARIASRKCLAERAARCVDSGMPHARSAAWVIQRLSVAAMRLVQIKPSAMGALGDGRLAGVEFVEVGVGFPFFELQLDLPPQPVDLPHVVRRESLTGQVRVQVDEGRLVPLSFFARVFLSARQCLPSDERRQEDATVGRWFRAGGLGARARRLRHPGQPAARTRRDSGDDAVLLGDGSGGVFHRCAEMDEPSLHSIPCRAMTAYFAKCFL